MIKLTKLNGEIFYINYRLIEKIEEVPHCVITMNSQVQYVAKESLEEINRLIIDFCRSIGITAQE